MPHEILPVNPVIRPITVAIVDDNRLVREALVAMLNRVGDMRAVGTGEIDAAFLEAETPDVLVLDVGLRDEDSLHVAERLARDAPRVKVIVMDLIPMHDDVAQFVSAGAWGFMLKDASLEEFTATIRTVAGGERVFPARLTDSLLTRIAATAETRSLEQMLDAVRMTRREREVIELIADGLSNKEIAQRLNIAAHTVKSHVRNVMEKLALHTRLQIAAFVRREGTP
jgi:DNA-binding NarL/FixJ family response regulator